MSSNGSSNPNEDETSLKHVINTKMSFWTFFFQLILWKLMQTFKWQDYIFWMKKENAAKASAYTLKASINAASSEAQKSPPSKWKTFFSRSKTRAEEPVVKNNIYDVGWIRNLCEVMVPLSERSSFSCKKSEWSEMLLQLLYDLTVVYPWRCRILGTFPLLPHTLTWC